MALKIDKMQLLIEIQNDTAIQNLKGLEKAISDAKKQLHGMKKGSPEWVEQEAKIKGLSNRYEELASEIKLTDMPLSLLVKRQRELTAAISNMKPSSENYAKYRAELDATKARISELRGTAKDTGFSLGKFADGFNKYAALATGAIASITGVAMTARKSVDDFAKMSEAEAQVSKYTDLTTEEIKQLNAEFKQMDTRTPREQLNALAGFAGQLGIKGKENIMQFVSAADKINVALGEDIGQDAVKTIGRLATMFGEDKRKGLQGAMLSTGSAINQLAQSVGADATYLVDFTARVGGVANQAKMSQADILGYAGVLNKNMQQVEMSGTAVQTVLMKMFQDPAKFARLAGKDVQQFTKLLKTDANEAFLQLLDTLNKQGGLDKLVPIFGQMGLDGARASQVLSTLAGKIGDIRAQQQIANQAYKEGTSVQNEFNVQNNTVQAGLDKAKKHFHDISVELGEKLEPSMKHVISGTSLLVEGMLEIIKFTTKWGWTIAGVTSGLAIYVVAINLATWAHKLHDFWVDKCVVSLKKLWATVLANPYAALAAGIGLVIGLVIDLVRHTNAQTEAMKSMERITKSANEEYAKQSAKIHQLSDIIHNNNLKLSERQAAINELKKIVPEYNAQLNAEGRIIKENTKAISAYLVELNKKIMFEASKDELLDLYRRRTQAIMEAREAQKQLTKDVQDSANNAGSNNTIGTGGWSTGVVGAHAVAVENSRINRLHKANQTIIGLNESIKELNKNIGKMGAAGISLSDIPGGDTGTGGGIAGKSDTSTSTGKTGKTDKKDPYAEELAALDRFHQQKLFEIKKNAQDTNQTEAQFNLDSIKENERYLGAKKAAIDKFSKISNKDNKNKIADDKIQTDTQILELQKQHNEAELRLLQENRDNQLSARDQLYNEEKLALSKSLADGTYTQEEYDSRLLDLELVYKNARVDILRQYSAALESSSITDLNIKTKAAKEANAAVLQADIEASTEKARKRKSEEDKEKQQQDKLKEIKDKYGLTTDKEKYDEQLKILDDFHAKGLLSEEQYQKAVKKLSEDTNQGKIIDWQKTAQAVAQIAGTLSDSISGFAEAETIASDAKFDRQIKAAKKAGKDTTKLEEEKEAAQFKIKKKYADLQFAAAVLQIASTTAVTAMEAYKAMAGIWGVGPALGAAAAAAAVLAGAAQIKVAKANRDAAKGLYSGGYSDEYVEGYTSRGNSHDVAGAIPVHKNEFVANHEAVANPSVRQFLDVFNVAQLNGRIRFLDTTAILSQLNLTGKYSGGYATSRPASPITPVITATDSSDVSKKLDQVLDLLNKIVRKKLVLAMTDVRDGLDDLKALESNASR